jgi:periplasmic copper chaperone A
MLRDEWGIGKSRVAIVSCPTYLNASQRASALVTRRACMNPLNFLGAALAGALMIVCAPAGATASDVKVGNLIIEAPWTRATPRGAKVGVGFFSIVNIGNRADKLVSAASPAVERIEIHRTTMENGVMRMRHPAGGLELKPREVTELKPGGLHLMLIGLKQTIAKGDMLPLQLVFEGAGKVDVTLVAAGIGAAQPPNRPDLRQIGGSHSGGSIRGPVGRGQGSSSN